MSHIVTTGLLGKGNLSLVYHLICYFITIVNCDALLAFKGDYEGKLHDG